MQPFFHRVMLTWSYAKLWYKFIMIISLTSVNEFALPFIEIDITKDIEFTDPQWYQTMAILLQHCYNIMLLQFCNYI